MESEDRPGVNFIKDLMLAFFIGDKNAKKIVKHLKSHFFGNK